MRHLVLWFIDKVVTRQGLDSMIPEIFSNQTDSRDSVMNQCSIKSTVIFYHQAKNPVLKSRALKNLKAFYTGITPIFVQGSERHPSHSCPRCCDRP